MEVENVIFDLGNVIIDLDIPRAERAFQDLGLSFSNAKAADLQNFLDFECGKISEELFINHLIKRAGNNVQAVDIMNAWNAMLVGIPLARLDLMRRVRDGYQTYILSNTNETHLRWVGRYLDRKYAFSSLDQFVHRAFYSNEMGYRKPNPEIYQQLLADEQLSPQATLFFDDHPDNIAAANQLGINAILVDPKEEIIDLVDYYL